MQISECICGYRNGTTKIAYDDVIRLATPLECKVFPLRFK